MVRPERDLSPERKNLYYLGMGLSVLGVVPFLSTFFTSLANFGNFEHFESRARNTGMMAFGGIVLIAVGQGIMHVGRQGLAGSGMKLDPKRMREDLEPWNRAAGGMMQDQLSEIDVVKKLSEHLESPEPEVMVRCRQCQALNPEQAKFCNQCGAGL